MEVDCESGRGRASSVCPSGKRKATRRWVGEVCPDLNVNVLCTFREADEKLRPKSDVVDVGFGGGYRCRCFMSLGMAVDVDVDVFGGKDVFELDWDVRFDGSGFLRQVLVGGRCWMGKER